MSTRNYISLGIMTGTSLDGLDISIIKSDGKTRIEIKGIGFIEATEKRTIHLKPGSYLVHAACAGHKTELTELKIPLQGSIEPKRIICGERI